MSILTGLVRRVGEAAAVATTSATEFTTPNPEIAKVKIKWTLSN